MPLGCVDETNGATDDSGDGCDWYIGRLQWCGQYDDEDFKANSMCCACKELGNF